MSAERPYVRSALVLGAGFTVIFFAFPIILAQLAFDPLFYYRVVLLIADLPLAALMIAVLWGLIRSRSRPPWGARFGAALLLLLAVSFVFHPSPQGAQTLLRLGGAISLATALFWLARDERVLVIAALGGTAIAQVGFAVAQLAQGGPLGLPSLGEFADPLYRVGNALAPRGTMYHQYVLAGLALLASCLLVLEALRSRQPAPWLVAAGLAVIPVGFAFSRSGAIGLVLVCGALLLGARARPTVHFAAVAVLVLGAGVAALVESDGWTQSTRPTLLNSREVLTSQALVLLADSPVVGIGPGRSVIALRSLLGENATDERLQPVHDVPLLAAVEGGPQAGLVAATIVAVLAWRARRSPRALALGGSLLPFFLLDHFLYTHAQGLILLGLWIGALEAEIAVPDEALRVRQGASPARVPAARS